MGLLQWMKDRLRKTSVVRQELEFEQQNTQEQQEYEHINFHDEQQRERYVTAKLEQIAESSKELENLTKEYNLVTSYLTDMELIDDLPPEIRAQLNTLSKQIQGYQEAREKGKKRKQVMTQEEYLHVDRIAEFMPEGYEKLKKTEEYQTLIKNDMSRLESEKRAYHMRKNELANGQRDMKGMTAICLGAMVVLIMILALLEQILHIDVELGYLMAVLITAGTLTWLYVKFADSSKEITRIEKSLNKLILLQNTVKIRYVNNTNLLDYLYMKYDVESAGALKKLWDQYQEENRLRQEQEQIKRDMEFSNAALLKVLRRCKLEDPGIWLHQTKALLENKEMSDIRHGLIMRRQKLRKQMEYNAKLAQDCQDEVKKIVQQYPQYAKPILDIVSEYEQALA